MLQSSRTTTSIDHVLGKAWQESFRGPHGSKYKKAVRKLSNLIINQLLPFDVVDCDEMQELLDVWGTPFKTPDRGCFTDSSVLQLYHTFRANLMGLMATASHIALTSDGWSNVNVDGYEVIVGLYW